MRFRTYSELRRMSSFEDRYRYLALRGVVGESTFGFERHLNQTFYRSRQWRQTRNHIIVRDDGMDLGVPDNPIRGNIIIHHMNPMTVDDLVNGEDSILDPEFLISVSLRTHNAIHYGDERLLPQPIVERRPGDTRSW
jgi:hypothetical protein